MGKRIEQRIYRRMTVRIAALNAEIADAERAYSPSIAAIIRRNLSRDIEVIRGRAMAQMAGLAAAARR